MQKGLVGGTFWYQLLTGTFMTLSIIAQIMIFISIWIVWVFRFSNIVSEFKFFGYSELFRSFIGATKFTLASFILAGIWYPKLVLYPTMAMAALMLGAQWTHFRVKNPFKKFVPSFLLLILCLIVIGNHLE
jgi:hypothetical protein